MAPAAGTGVSSRLSPLQPHHRKLRRFLATGDSLGTRSCHSDSHSSHSQPGSGRPASARMLQDGRPDGRRKTGRKTEYRTEDGRRTRTGADGSGR
eukprot:4611002-Prymnesium_polylepis.1